MPVCLWSHALGCALQWLQGSRTQTSPLLQHLLASINQCTATHPARTVPTPLCSGGGVSSHLIDNAPCPCLIVPYRYIGVHVEEVRTCGWVEGHCSGGKRRSCVSCMASGLHYMGGIQPHAGVTT